MNRLDIRTAIKRFLAEKGVKTLTVSSADELLAYLCEQYPDTRFGNVYEFGCEYDELFEIITGIINRCDPYDPESVIDSVTFKIDKNLRVTAWDQTPAVLTLDMNALTEDDLADIAHINQEGKVDIHKTFMRTPAKDRGKLAAMIPQSLALELFGNDIPPYAFYHYDGKFYSPTGRAVGDLGGSFGFGGFVSVKRYYRLQKWQTFITHK